MCILAGDSLTQCVAGVLVTSDGCNTFWERVINLSGFSVATQSMFVTSPSGSVAFCGMELFKYVARALSPSRHIVSCLLNRLVRRCRLVQIETYSIKYSCCGPITEPGLQILNALI